MTYHLTTGDHNESAETLGEYVGETFADLDDAQSAADHLNEHLAGIGADFRAAVVAPVNELAVIIERCTSGLGAGVPTPDECLAVAQLALAGLLTLPGAADRCAMCGVVEMALLVCEDREVRRLISSMLLIAEALTAHCEDEIDALRDPQEALGEMKGQLMGRRLGYDGQHEAAGGRASPSVVYWTKAEVDDGTAANLTAIDTHDGIVVEDCEGGIWHPSDDAAAEIAATDDPHVAAVKMCRSAPGRGRWSS